MTATIDLILSKLGKVKAAGAGKWKACCPAHADRDPSLSVREAVDGTILLHCWAGCETREVLAAIGFELRDLFPGDGKGDAHKGPSRAAIELERQVVTIGRAMLVSGETLPPADLERLELAHQRLASLEGRV